MPSSSSQLYARKKSPNWSHEEKLHLVTEVGKRWSALYADACDIMTTRTIRQDAWEELTAVHCLHPSCPRKRSVMEVKKQWQNLIVRSKQERLQADEWRAAMGDKSAGMATLAESVLNVLQNRASSLCTRSSVREER